MAENAPAKLAGAGANDTAAAGIPFYEKQRQHLKELIARKRALEKRIATQEDSIYSKETEYLETTPSGNIITGFDNYTKGASTAAAQRRKTGLTDANRVFSRSSISYNPNHQDAQTPASSHSTPASHAPTPLSTSFANSTKDKDASGSGAPTPTSATASKAGGTSKKSKKSTAAAATAAAAAAAVAAAAAAAASAAGAGDDSETDSRDAKKVRTNFGAVRK
ncbi:histone acetyltransferase subunit NuA4-domain-containing protein [Lasiosphaeria hispida]|uniref:Chromatin modification-related protein EAF6 n=1 Tax=Lasiosphaeria hispida TaxID=260671 RepID=A0AAJ0M831_9PEZI|nr:histone acetyltransferase subunit NuA4-domain-containing protein [Lasiosphaeria hispida]